MLAVTPSGMASRRLDGYEVPPTRQSSRMPGAKLGAPTYPRFKYRTYPFAHPFFDAWPANPETRVRRSYLRGFAASTALRRSRLSFGQ
jgi:hypothetical protein